MYKCNRFRCNICPYVKEQKTVHATHTNHKVHLNKHYNCTTSNIVYIIQCKKDKCKDQYIGQTQNSLSSRFLDHLGYCRREEISKATGAHFNKPGHSMADMTISVLEQVSEKDTFYRECRESKHIQDFDLLYNGINRKRWLVANCNQFKNQFICFQFSFLYGTVNCKLCDCCGRHLSEDDSVKLLKCITVLEFNIYV